MSLNPEGGVVLHLHGQPYRLHLGMSALAAVQAAYEGEFNALVGGQLGGKLPSFAMIHMMFVEALRRHHPDRADDRHFVDDLIAATPGAVDLLLGASAPAKDDAGNRPAARTKAAPRR